VIRPTGAIGYREGMKRVVVWLLCVMTLLGGGWGEAGHRTCGVIAAARLTPTTTKAVEALLGDRTLATAGTWADEVRKNPSYDWAKPLHYVNVPVGATSIDLARDCPPDEKGHGVCVLGGIERFSAVLRDNQEPPESKVEALLFLIHFIEDLHQPLHVSYAKDRGGNMITVSFLGKPGANLHRVWDTDMIEQKLKQSSEGDWMRYAIAMRDGLTDEQACGYQATDDPMAWAQESLAITGQIYKDLPTATGNIDAEYMNRWMPVVEERLRAAGVRLAMHLNAIFDPACTATEGKDASPAAPASQPASAPATVPASGSTSAPAPATSPTP
jgi:hypothetical protein